MSDVKTVKPLSENARGVISFLQAHEGAYTVNAIAEALGLNNKSIQGVMTSLVKKEICAKAEDKVNVEVEGKNGPETRSYFAYFLTDTGRNTDVSE